MKDDTIINQFKKLLEFDSDEQEQDHKARMISFRFLSEIEKRCDEMKLSRSELAAGIGTSKSYITQLFRGDKHVNTKLLAKVELLLGIKFEIVSTEIFHLCYKTNRQCKYKCGGLCKDAC